MASSSTLFPGCAARPAIGRRLVSRFCSAGVLLFLGLPPGRAATELTVAPTRIMLEADHPAGEVFVINRGSEPITARISLVNRHMREDGSFVAADAPETGEYFADRFLQYAPRRVRLEPGQGQTVRVLARLPQGAGPAEYRSHLLFRVEPPVDPKARLRNEASRSENGSGNRRTSIRLTPVYGITIPVIVRSGTLAATASIDGIAVRPRRGKPPAVEFRLHRTGNRSIYGDLRLLFQPSGGAERLVGESLGLAVYTPLTMRRVFAPLNRLRGDALPPGRLRVELVDHDDGSRVLAEAERTLP
jgi:hypothetical protein